jgi:hypothetical protein
MGMHMGFMAAGVPWAMLRPAIESRGRPLVLDYVLPTAEWLDPKPGEDFLHAATYGGHAYVLDSSMVMTSAPDLVAELAKELDCAVFAAGAETVSGTFWLFAVDRGQVRRLHWNVRATLTQPLDLGEPFASENRIAIEDPDGRGLRACLADFGFDPGVLTGPISDGERYRWAETKLPAPGPLAAQINAHHSAFERRGQGDWAKHIKAVARDGGGFDMQYVPPAEKKSVLKRLFGR